MVDTGTSSSTSADAWAGVGHGDLFRWPAEPWRNGGGTTRTLLADTSLPAWHWRISCADIVQDGQYSSFEGIDREQWLIQGERLWLTGLGDGMLLERPGDSVRFPGEARLHARVLAGPVRVWNVMTRRPGFTSETRVQHGLAASLDLTPSRIARVALVLGGSYELRVDGHREGLFRPGHFLWATAAEADVRLEPVGPSARLIQTDVSHTAG